MSVAVVPEGAVSYDLEVGDVVARVRFYDYAGNEVGRDVERKPEPTDDSYQATAQHDSVTL